MVNSSHTNHLCVANDIGRITYITHLIFASDNAYPHLSAITLHLRALLLRSLFPCAMSTRGMSNSTRNELNCRLEEAFVKHIQGRLETVMAKVLPKTALDYFLKVSWSWSLVNYSFCLHTSCAVAQLAKERTFNSLEWSVGKTVKVCI